VTSLRRALGFRDVALFFVVAVVSPRWIASAAAEPGIHPKGFVEDDSDDDGPDSPAPKGGKPKPAPDDLDDER